MKIRFGGCLALCCLPPLFAAGAPADPPAASAWSPKSAAAYLDQRAAWWMAWPVAARDQGTFCISCHTAVPFALARPALRAALTEDAPGVNETKLLDNISKRVRLWNQMKPFYDDSAGENKAVQSRGTEAVLNALILARYDAPKGTIVLSAPARSAFDQMWALQRTTGAAAGSWSWLDFNNAPWETRDSAYYGAALAALAVGLAPDAYRSAPDLQPKLRLLRDYLNRQFASQSPINQAVALWASAKWPGLLPPELARSFIDGILPKQQRDGGWNLVSLSWGWKDFTVRSLARMRFRSDAGSSSALSDGYATALTVLALEPAVPPGDNHLRQAIAWLIRNQDRTTGQWSSYSLNTRRNRSAGVGLFMNDAATAYAVLALTGANQVPAPRASLH